MVIEILDTQKRFKIPKAKIKSITTKFLKHLKISRDCILTVTFVSQGKIKQLNRKYFKKSWDTDVIALESGDFKNGALSDYLGDIIISPEKAKQNCRRFNTTQEREIFLYVAHGLLHLLGYDDLIRKNRIEMERKQQKLMELYDKD